MTELPDGWTWATIGEVCEKPKYGWTTSASDIGEVKLLRTTDLTHGPITWETVPFCKETPKTVAEYEVHPNDIFISRAGSVGVSVLVKDAPYKSVFASYLIRIRPTNKINAKYLSLFLQSPHYWNQVSELSSGIALANINATKIQSMTLPLPPIDEQHKIVELLEDHLSRLDAALADVKQAKAKAAQFRSALLQSIFEGKYSATSDTWEFRTIGNFAEVKGGKRLPKGTKWSDKPTLHPYIRATDIKFGQIKVEDLVHVPDFVWKSISRYVVEENDVVITIAGTIGDVAVVPRILAGANLTENAAKLVFDHDYVMPSYLSMYLQSPSVQQELKELSRATTQAKLALYRIATVKIPIPTLYEQQKIMELVDEKLTYLTSSLNQISASELHASSLRRALLQAAFTGQLTNEVVSV